jgi:hypothetical protein
MGIQLGKKPAAKQEAKQEAKQDLSKIVLTSSEDKETSKSSGLGLSLTKNLNKAVEEKVEKVTSEEIESISFPKEFYEIPEFDAQQFEANVLNMANQLAMDDPDIKTYILEINRNLRQYPQLAHLLTDETRGLIFQGFKYVKKIEIVAKKPAKSSSATLDKVLKQSADEILDSKSW